MEQHKVAFVAGDDESFALCCRKEEQIVRYTIKIEFPRSDNVVATLAQKTHDRKGHVVVAEDCSWDRLDRNWDADDLPAGVLREASFDDLFVPSEVGQRRRHFLIR